MQFTDAISSGFRNYVTFAGRASRSEFWLWVLFTLLVSAATEMFDAIAFPNVDTGVVSSLWELAILLPSIAIGARRLHDRDYSGWWLLLWFSVIGGIILIVWYCLRGTEGPNRYGPDPLAALGTLPTTAVNRP